MSGGAAPTGPGAAPDLRAAAREAVRAAGFVVDLDPAVAAELRALDGAPPDESGGAPRDLRALLWSSIDNVDTRDLDQVEHAEPLGGGAVRLRVGIADVDAFVPRGSAIDRRAGENTTSVYTAPETFPMLPERLSTDLTSLVAGADRRCVVLELVVGADGEVAERRAYEAVVCNRAQLDYDAVGDWLAGSAAPPAAVAASEALAAQLRLQHEVAERLRTRRLERGALELETVELRPVVVDGRVVDLATVRPGPARALISDFMIAANAATAGLLDELGVPAIRRVVESPHRWSRLVALAATLGATLPPEASAPALAAFLRARRAADPAGYPELSLSVIKLLGAGEYAVQLPTAGGGAPRLGHFALAAPDYTHSTAPNRRYADLVTQRQLKAALGGTRSPYTPAELTTIAARCTEREDEARRVERLVAKQAAAALLAGRVGETFDAVVTGAKPTATYARLLDPPVDGRVVRGEAGLDVGDRVRLTLLETDVGDGFIDFARA